MIVVSNSGPLIALARVGQLHLLPALFGKLYIPDAVRLEVVAQGSGRAGSDDVAVADWIQSETVDDRLGVGLLRDRLGEGESEAIVLAIEKTAGLLLIDEERGRRVAETRGLNIMGTLGVLVLAKKRGHLDEITTHLDALVGAGFRMDRLLYDAVKELAGER